MGEVYAFYGDDVLESSVAGECGPVSLFGGFGADTFIIDGDVARATVQDYEAGEPILLPRKAGAVTYELNAGMTPTTTVLVDGVPVFDLSGIWGESDLNIRFNDGKNVRRVTTKPSRQPTSDLPTVQTSDLPTVQTSNLPTFLSSNLPTVQTSYLPTVQTSDLPTFQTSDLPTSRPAICPLSRPASCPLSRPTTIIRPTMSWPTTIIRPTTIISSVTKHPCHRLGRPT